MRTLVITHQCTLPTGFMTAARRHALPVDDETKPMITLTRPSEDISPSFPRGADARVRRFRDAETTAALRSRCFALGFRV